MAEYYSDARPTGGGRSLTTTISREPDGSFVKQASLDAFIDADWAPETLEPNVPPPIKGDSLEPVAEAYRC